MIRNIIFFFVTIGALAWVLYAGLNLVNFSGKSNPEKLFGKEDGRIFIVNRPQETNIEQTDFKLQPRLKEIYSIFFSSMIKGDKIFVSENKGHLFLQTNSLLSEENVMSRFKDFESIATKKYKYKNFKINFFKGAIDCQIESEKNSTNSISWSSFDKKSSYSIIEFDKSQAIIKDFYIKNGSKIMYTRRPSTHQVYKSFDDQAIYANFIPSMISSYQFIEKFTFSKKDGTFEKSPAFSWTNSGVVSFEFNKANFLLMDLLDGYDPQQMIHIYLDTSKNIRNNYTGLLLAETFPYNTKKGFFLKQFDNYVLVCDKESALNEAEIAIELGQTLGRHKEKQKLIYSDAPKNIVERIWNATTKQSLSTYKGNLLGVEIQTSSKLLENSVNESEVRSYAMNGLVTDFVVHPTKDLVFCLDKSNTLSGFGNGKNFMNLKLNENFVGNLSWTKNENPNLVFTTSTKLYVIDINGNVRSGFPIEIAGGISKGVTDFIYKKNENYLLASYDGKYHWVNQKGETIRTGTIDKNSTTHIPSAWISARKLFFGFNNGTEFSMIDAEKGKVFRTFPISKNAIPKCLENEIKFYDLELNNLVQYDQKGTKFILTSVKSPIWVRSMDNGLTADGFCLKNGNVISYYTRDGQFSMKAKLKFESVDYVAYLNSQIKGELLAALDGLTNTIAIYGSNGNKISMPKNQAQKKIAFSTQGNQVKIYTIIDKFVIQYVL